MGKYIAIIIFVLYLLLFGFLCFNIKKKNIFIKYIFSFFFLSVLFYFFATNEVIIDTLLYSVVKLLRYPDFSSYLIIIAITIGIFIYNIFNDKIPTTLRIMNYIYILILFVSYVLFWLLNVDVTKYTTLYEGKSLFFLRVGTYGFGLWMVSIVIYRYIKYFFPSNKKVKKKLIIE